MVYVKSDSVLELIRVALDDLNKEPIHEIEEVHSIVYHPVKEDDSQACIYGEIGLRMEGVSDLVDVRFKIFEEHILIFQELNHVNEEGELIGSFYFFPIYNIKKLAKMLEEFTNG